MGNLPADTLREPEIVESSKVIEPEIVGYERPSHSWLMRVRVALGVVLGLIGAGLTLIGTLLTVSILGAPLGIPLIFVGLLLIFVGTMLPAGSGKTRVVSYRWPGPWPCADATPRQRTYKRDTN